MKGSQEYIQLMNRLQELFKQRDDSYTLCVVIGEIECALLRFIHKINRPMTMKEIAQMYSISSSKVTRILNRLEKMGFVERYHSTNDRRNWYARITMEGRKMADNTKYKLDQFQKNVLSRLPEGDIDIIYDRIKQFVDAYESVIKESEGQ
jgi:DNA-binding MarR family transcriptional regulator